MKKTGFRITFEDGETHTRYLQPIATKKCIIRFEADSDDIKNGVFGFDEIPYNGKAPDKTIRKLSRICLSDINKLKDEYTPITVNGKEYFVPWVSIRKDQTITLDLDITIKEKDQYESIAFKEHPDFTITPTDKKGNKIDLKEAKKVKITCKNTNQNTTQIKVMADGKEAGAINFWYPKPKSIDLKWYFVEITGGRANNDKDDLEDLIDQTKLETLLKKGLNPALIDVTIVNDSAEIIDITKYKDRLKSRKLLNTYRKTDGSTIKYIERGVKGSKANQLFTTFKLVHTRDTSIINLYCINRKCINTVDIVEDGSYPMAGGLSPVNKGIAYMILDDDKKMLPKNIIHEILHSFGLEHTLNTKATHTFKEKKTNNYMDYSNTRFLTRKWQWIKLQEYLHLK